MTITVPISETGHVVRAGIYNHLLPLHILYTPCPQQTQQLVIVLYLWNVLPSFLKALGH